MSFAFLPLYTGDYLRDTSDLTLTEHGIYLRLLMYSWDSRGPVPVDEARAARIVGASSDDERNAVKSILLRYFVRHDDGWYQPRMDREIAKANAIAGVRSEAGKRGAARTWAKDRASAMANAMASAMAPATTPTPTPTSTPTTTPTSNGRTERVAAKAPPRKRLPDDWKLPKDWGEWALTERKDWTPDYVRKVAAMFADHWHSKAEARADWLATWREIGRASCRERVWIPV